MMPGTDKRADRSLAFPEGDQWGGIPGISITLKATGAPPTPAAQIAVIQFRKDWETETISTTLSSEDAEIVITSAANWTFVVPAQNLPLMKEGEYVWAFRVMDITGAWRTYETGNVTVGPRTVL